MILHNRQTIRLKGYDYSSNGAYFITICTQNRELLFGNIPINKMVFNQMGKIVKSVWESLPKHHHVELDEFQIMPNHIHGIIIICWGFARKTPTDQGIARFGHVIPGSLSCVIRSFKSECTKQIRLTMDNNGFFVWQRNYYEHVIRNGIELNKIREYIKNNPQMWDRDRNNPQVSDKIIS